MYSEKTFGFKDVVIVLLLIIVGVIMGVSVFNGLKPDMVPDKVFSFISIIIIYVLGMITLFDIGNANGLTFFVPNFYIRNKKEKQVALTKDILEEHYRKEKAFLKTYNDDRIKYFMNQLGLTSEQFEDVKLEILRIRLMKMGTDTEIENKLKEIVAQDYVMIKSADYLPGDLVYHEVRYFLNFADIMYSPLGDDIACMLSNFIKNKLGRGLGSVQKIVVSENGNYLLGLSVSKDLSKNFVKILPKQRIFKSQYWEGSLKADEKIIIVHDVLVTADQIISSIEKFPKPYTVVAVFCLVNRVDHHGEAMLIEKKIPVHSILRLSDCDIERML